MNIDDLSIEELSAKMNECFERANSENYSEMYAQISVFQKIRAQKSREMGERAVASAKEFAAEVAKMDEFCESKGLQLPKHPPLPFLDLESNDVPLLEVMNEELSRIDFGSETAREWIAFRERVNVRLKAINDERELAHEAKAAEARAEAERRQAERERAQKELEEMQRKLAEADAAAKQAADEAANQADSLDKIRGKAPVEA